MSARQGFPRRRGLDDVRTRRHRPAARECAHGLHGVNLEVEDRHLTSHRPHRSSPVDILISVPSSPASQRTHEATPRLLSEHGAEPPAAVRGGGARVGAARAEEEEVEQQQQQQQQQEQHQQVQGSRRMRGGGASTRCGRWVMTRRGGIGRGDERTNRPTAQAARVVLPQRRRHHSRGRAPGKPARVLVGGAVHFATKRWRTTSRSRRR